MDELQTAIANLQNSNPDIQQLALDKIGTLKPDNALEIILPFLSDPNPKLRVAAAFNLGDISESRAVSHLIEVSRKDPEEEVRGEALAALENYRDPEILKCLVDEVYREKQSRRPRQVAAQQLQHYNDEQSVEALIILLLEDEDVYVRIYAADSLLALNRPRLYEVWKEALEDYSTYVIGRANKALQDLQNYEDLIMRN